MRIAVMGAGGVGGYFGGLLARSGQEVTFIARGEHLKAIRERGLRIESVTAGDFTIHPPTMERPDGSLQADLALFCVKTYHNAEAVHTVAPLVGPQTAVLTLQNGVSSGEELAEAFGAEKVLAGAAYVESSISVPGVVAHVGAGRIVFGEIDGQETARAKKIHQALEQAGIPVQLSTNVLKELWDKFIFICALSGMTSITMSPLGDVLDCPETRQLLLKVMQEVEAVGRARGVDLDHDVVEQTMTLFTQSRSEFRSSMQLDLELGNRLEVAALNGTVSRYGRELGVPTPVNEFIYSCHKLADDKARTRR